MSRPSICCIVGFLATLASCAWPQLAWAEGAWLLNQNSFYNGKVKAELSKNSLLITLNTDAQVFAAAPAWKVYIFDRKAGVYCVQPFERFINGGLHSLTNETVPQYSDSLMLKKFRNKTARICTQQATCFRFRYPKPFKVQTDEMRLSQNKRGNVELLTARIIWLADNIILDRHAALILSSVYGFDCAFDKAILEKTAERAGEADKTLLETSAIKPLAKAPEFDQSILKLKQVLSTSEVAFSGKKFESEQLLDGFGFGK